mmetsp:Transcript_20105/g.17805  ORF Transcript_20105/g.17805 Transcript_20105/m.17805 type:complete len:100 (+) Transcript_20105:358-657(+)
MISTLDLSQTPFSRLYNNINTSFLSFRQLLNKYSENIEIVDPQLKNNEELVEGIVNFENTWSKGNLYLLEEDKFNSFIVLSQYINHLIKNYPDFKAQIE